MGKMASDCFDIEAAKGIWLHSHYRHDQGQAISSGSDDDAEDKDGNDESDKKGVRASLCAGLIMLIAGLNCQTLSYEQLTQLNCTNSTTSTASGMNKEPLIEEDSGLEYHCLYYTMCHIP